MTSARVATWIRARAIGLSLILAAFLVAGAALVALVPIDVLVDMALRVSPVPVTPEELPALRDKAAAALARLPRTLMKLGLAGAAFALIAEVAARRDRVKVSSASSAEALMSRSRGIDILACVVLVAAGLALAWPFANRPLQWDEIDNLREHLSGSLLHVLTTNRAALNHLGFSVPSWVSIQVFGPEPWAVRLPALLAGAAFHAILWLMVRRRLGIAAGLAVAVIALLWGDVRSATTEARGYALVLAGAALHFQAFRRLLRDVTPGWIAAWIATFALTATCHLWFVLAGVAEVCWVLARAGLPALDRAVDPHRGRRLDARSAYALLLVGLIAAVVLQAGIAHKYLYMLSAEPVMTHRPALLGAVGDVLVGSSMGGTARPLPMLDEDATRTVQWGLAAAALALLTVAAVRARRDASLRDDIAFAIFQVVLLTVVIAVTKPVHAEGRYLLFVIVPLAVSVAAGAAALARRGNAPGIEADVAT